MKANELRVGNWVRKKGSDTKIQVDPSILNVSELINYQPIPLTPEILEKCGFDKKQNKLFVYQLKRVRIWVGTAGCISYLDNEDKDESIYIGELSYLHQLQNLFYSITGEELNYQP